MGISKADASPTVASQGCNPTEPTLQESSNSITLAELGGLALDSTTTNGMVTAMFASQTMGVNLGLKEMVLELNRQVTEAQNGDRKQAESLLQCQATTLNAIFIEMARRSASNMGKNLEAMEAYMRMALRAQNQSRATLETLSVIKNPSVVVAKQANISAGPQQVNNLIAATCPIDVQNQPNQLSGALHELRQNP